MIVLCYIVNTKMKKGSAFEELAFCTIRLKNLRRNHLRLNATERTPVFQVLLKSSLWLHQTLNLQEKLYSTRNRNQRMTLTHCS
ncbi:hypothetical protein V202x_33550 [Gimesia aquarii]|uniref:Uncharacterized protein n=1 Tax=Gimesia aquarii TaxID=2527964 RepID=A0A517WXI1_9PLAN|nr:hypothetical protein V202x_33550 [Gimesia aquarii]